MYWADSGQFPRIVRAFLDGSNQTDLATIGVVHPCGITIDIQTHDVLWVDRTADVLEKMDWQGGNRRIIRSGLPNPTGVAVFRDSVRILILIITIIIIMIIYEIIIIIIIIIIIKIIIYEIGKNVRICFSAVGFDRKLFFTNPSFS